MPADHVGYLDHNERIRRLQSARCMFQNHQLDIEARGRNCKLKIYGIPFPDAESISELPGKSFGPESEAMKSDPIAEGGIEFTDSYLSWESLTLRCKSHNAANNTLSISFHGEVSDPEWGNRGSVDGSVVCEIQDSLR